MKHNKKNQKQDTLNNAPVDNITELSDAELAQAAGGLYVNWHKVEASVGSVFKALGEGLRNQPHWKTGVIHGGFG